MKYNGDYGFDEFLAGGGAASDGEVAKYLTSFLSHGFYKMESDVQTGEFGCSTICTRDEHGTVFFLVQSILTATQLALAMINDIILKKKLTVITL